MNELMMQIHSALFFIDNWGGGGGSPQPPPVCSFHIRITYYSYE